MSGEASQAWKAVLALLAVGVVIGRTVWLRRDPGARARVEQTATWAFAVLAVVSVVNYFGGSIRNLTDPKKFDGYDLMHYYLNAKYFDELGYTLLYDAILIADSEQRDNYRRWHLPEVRDLDTSVRKPVATVYARAASIKAHFRAARWARFKRDFRFIQRTMSRRSQERMLRYDHGYNGPPFMQTFAGPITNLVPVERLKLLCHVELVGMVLLFLLVGRTFGRRTMWMSVLWFSVSFSARWPGIDYGIFRVDWFFALVAACCLAHGIDDPTTPRRRARAVGAGVLLAYSSMMKLFPAAWVAGLGIRALWHLASRRRVEPVAAMVLGGFTAGLVVFGAISVAGVGTRNIAEFAEDIHEHLQPMNLSDQRMGFGMALAYRGEWSGRGFPSQRAMHARWELVGAQKPLQYAIAALALVLLGLTIRPRDAEAVGARTDADDALMLGFIPFYFFLIASHYYWIHRMTMVLHHDKHAESSLPHTGSLAALFAIEALTNLVDTQMRFRYVTTTLTSVALGIYCTWVILARLHLLYRPPSPAR